MKKIVIIGSGIGSITATKALVKRGIKPLILDTGNIIDKDKLEIKNKLKKLNYNDWSKNDYNKLFKKEKNKSIFKKQIFGSNYFYGKNLKVNKFSDNSEIPFFSYAKGGLSEGWGGAVLSPDFEEIKDWPIDKGNFEKYLEITLNDLPYITKTDDLSNIFPTYTNNNFNLKKSFATNFVINELKNKNNLTNLLVGNSRLLTRINDDSNFIKCQYCGRCISGCVYDSIYNSKQDLEKLLENNQINYSDNIIVKKLINENNRIKIEFIDLKSNIYSSIYADKVFLGAGSINSTRIIMNSNNYFNKNYDLKSKGQIIFPLFSRKSLLNNWPHTNTQPDIYMEYKYNDEFWTHTQINTSNDLFINIFPSIISQNKIFDYFIKKLMNHFFVAHTTINSFNSDYYRMFLDHNDNLNIKLINNNKTLKTLNNIQNELKVIFKNSNFRTINPLILKNNISLHNGSSMPMSINPKDNETNIYGNPKNFKNVHIIDSSILPSLPATPIGLLIMANASRIATEVNLNE
ncbi:MAG: hypothetical protein CFH19_00712 [Alphaproteobacteria bacterium MarineAlpha5_Bin9]|nr:MAG: hypothetical protein CFH19_00712 [Alphaproteobacteria bacterium MarineAlpha5_Bin9]|tara:strand:+ start:2971 stop:4521 length:1551 start_codon:yes stop_codon:yes gene_type:complete